MSIVAYLLQIPGTCYRSINALKDNVTQLSTGNILNNVPLHWKEPIPVFGLPKVQGLDKVHSSDHFSYAYKLPTPIDLIYRTRNIRRHLFD